MMNLKNLTEEWHGKVYLTPEARSKVRTLNSLNWEIGYTTITEKALFELMFCCDKVGHELFSLYKRKNDFGHPKACPEERIFHSLKREWKKTGNIDCLKKIKDTEWCQCTWYLKSIKLYNPKLSEKLGL